MTATPSISILEKYAGISAVRRDHQPAGMFWVADTEPNPGAWEAGEAGEG